MSESRVVERNEGERRFLSVFSIVLGLVLLAVPLYAVLGSPSGSLYLGYEFNTDDHMVYAAWMRQAMDGRFLFDNRFTTDPQPGLTVHVFFWLLGNLARLTGIVIATHLARVGFGILFLFLLYRLVGRLKGELGGTKLATGLAVVGSGLGFLVWQTFGQTIVRPAPAPLASFLGGRLPTDVWQPEGFVLPSLLTSGLFAVSLCLILGAFLCFLDARNGWRPVAAGALIMAALMNIHSYDALTVTLVMVGFGVATLVRGQLTGGWLGRALVIGLGAIPPALWFVHVLQQDPVFQARVATPTYSPNFRQVLVGYGLLILLGFVSLGRGMRSSRRKQVGVALAGLLVIVLTVLAGQAPEGGYFLSPIGWGATFLVALAAVALLAEENPAWNLTVSWAIIGLIAIYFPAMFQRKLTMGLSVPWAILAAGGIERMLARQERSARNLVMTLAILVCGASSYRWIFREAEYVRMNVASTTREPVYLTTDVRKIISFLNAQTGRTTVIAFPGSSSPLFDEQGNQVPDTATVVVPDTAPIVSGFTGAYSYAGHWSETPDYLRRVSDCYQFFLSQPMARMSRVMTPEERAAFVAKEGLQYAIVPMPEAFPGFPLEPPTALGAVVVPGSQFSLVRLGSVR